MPFLSYSSNMRAMHLRILMLVGFILDSKTAYGEHTEFKNSKHDGQIYNIVPQKLGAKIYGVNISVDPDRALITRIVEDVYKYKLLVFKDQGEITAERHVEIGYWFGDHIDTQHRVHEKAEHPAVFRVSNDDSEGYRNVGNKGWHIDGFFSERPHAFVLYHMRSLAQKGYTAFVDLEGVVGGLTPDEKSLWERLYIRCKLRDIVHPLIYTHPVTRSQTICINTQFVDELIVDYNTSQESTLSDSETEKIIAALEKKFELDHYAHEWEDGDFLMTDNLALAHIASNATQLPREEIGLRVLHRVSVAGSMTPMKEPPPTKDPSSVDTPRDGLADEL